MNTSNDRDEKMGHEDGQEWQSADFSWDNMKDGIFGKILEEDPQFFEEKRRRRLPLWLWFSGVGLLVLGIGFWQWVGHPQSKAPSAQPVPIEPKTAQIIAGGEQKPAPSDSREKAKIEASMEEVPHQDLKQKSKATKHFEAAGEHFSPKKATPKAAVALDNLEEKPLNQLVVSEAPNTPTEVAAILAENIAVLGIVPFPIVTSLPNLPNRPLSAAPKKTATEKGQLKLAVSGGGQASFSKYSGSSGAVSLRNDHSSAYLGYQFGVEAWVPLRKNNYLLLGLGRQATEQKIDIRTQREVDYLYANTLVSVTHYVVGGRMENHYDDVLGKATENNRLLKYNRFVSTQVSLGFGNTFGSKNWQFSPFLGAGAGLFSNTEGKTVAANKAILTYKTADIFKRVQWSGFAGFELDRKLTEQVSLLFRYRFDKQWNNASKEPGMDLKPAYHAISFGAAYRFVKTNK